MDSTTVLYQGEVTVFFKEKSHRYWALDSKKGDKKFSVPGVTGTSDNQFHLKGHLVDWAGKFDSRWLGEQLQSGKLLTEELILEAAKAHMVHRDMAADIGTLVHSLAEEWFSTGIKPAIPKIFSAELDKEKNEAALMMADNALHNIGLILENNEIEVIALEDVVYYRPGEGDETPAYTGTRDLFVKWNGVLTSGDWKTNNSDHYFRSKELKKGKKVEEIQPTGLSPSVLYQLGGYDEAKGQETGEYSKQHIGINLAKHRKYRTYREFTENHIRISTEVEKNRGVFKKLAQARFDTKRTSLITKERTIKTEWY